MSTNTNKNEEAPKIYLEQKEKLAFPSELGTHMTTTYKICELIGDFFAPVIPDFSGAFVEVINGVLVWSIYLRDKAPKSELEEGQIKGVIGTINRTTKSDSIVDRIKNMNAVNKARNVVLTDACKSVLEPFMLKNGKNVNWDQCTSEITDTDGISTYVYLRIAGLDIYAILKEIYGRTIEVDGEKHTVDYNVQIIRPISGIGRDVIYLVSILQLDTVNVARLCNSVGVMPTTGRISMVGPR